MGNIYKSKAERLKGDPYIGVCFQALETLEFLCLIQDFCQTKAWCNSMPFRVAWAYYSKVLVLANAASLNGRVHGKVK